MAYKVGCVRRVSVQQRELYQTAKSCLHSLRPSPLRQRCEYVGVEDTVAAHSNESTIEQSVAKEDHDSTRNLDDSATKNFANQISVRTTLPMKNPFSAPATSNPSTATSRTLSKQNSAALL